MEEALSLFAYREMIFGESENIWGKIMKQYHRGIHYDRGMILVKALKILISILFLKKWHSKDNREKG
jgi:hypothetical protein